MEPENTLSKGKKLVFLLAMATLVAVLLIVGAMILISRQRINAARFLRPQETLALFTHAETLHWKSYANLFPVLELVPEMTCTECTLAITKVGNSLGWVLIGDAPLTPNSRGTYVTPTTAVMSSHPQWSAPTEGEVTLADFLPYQTLSMVTTGEAAYIDLKHVRSEVTTPWDQFMVTLASHFPAAAIMHTGKTLTLTLGSAQVLATQTTIAPPITGIEGNPLFVVSSARTMELWNSALAQMHASERALVEGRVAGLARSVFGDQISLRYDVLPLLQKGSVIAFYGSGTLLEGTVETEDEEQHLGRIAESVRQMLPQSRTITKTFERGFSTTVLTSSPEAVIDRQENIQGWEVRTLWSTERNRGIVLARRGNRFRILTERTLIPWALQTGSGNTLHNPPVLSPIPEPIVFGKVTKAGVQTIAEKILGLTAKGTIVPPSPMLFGIQSNGSLLRIVIEGQ